MAPCRKLKHRQLCATEALQSPPRLGGRLARTSALPGYLRTHRFCIDELRMNALPAARQLPGTLTAIDPWRQLPVLRSASGCSLEHILAHESSNICTAAQAHSRCGWCWCCCRRRRWSGSSVRAVKSGAPPEGARPRRRPPSLGDKLSDPPSSHPNSFPTTPWKQKVVLLL